MQRSTGLVLLCLALLLVLFPLAVGKPGLPVTLKADEPAYYLSALSLARDGDLRCDTDDLARLYDEYPYLATFNLILMTDDGWRTVFFGKPYIYSLLAAPMAGWFGANGMVAFNMLLLMAMIWMGATYLTRFNPAPIAALYAAGFFLLSNAFAYVFWLHPEIFNMACVGGSLFLVFHRFDDGPGVGRWARTKDRIFGPRARVAWSGALLAAASYNKPMLAAMALPVLYLLWQQRRDRRWIVWLGASVVALLALCGISILFTGHPSAYLGVERMGVHVFDPHQMPVTPVERAPAADSPTTNSWTWLARVPEVDWRELTADVGYFFVGRHTGLLLYMPFAALSLLLFLLHDRRSKARWLTLLALATVALFFLVWIPFNWPGGGGFVGNRYFVNVYPAFLFLVTTIRPAWLTSLGFAAGGLLLGPILFTPFGAPVPEPTLQAHVRNTPMRWFPLELKFRKKLPGYHGTGMSGAWFFGRKDTFRARNSELEIHGAMAVELWMMTPEELVDPAVFELRNLAPRNRVTVDLGGDRQVIEFDSAGVQSPVTIALTPSERPRSLTEGRRTVQAYRLLIDAETGAVPNAARNAAEKNPVNEFFVGVAVSYLGTQADLDRDLFAVDWGDCEFPLRVEIDEDFLITTRLSNRSSEVWPSRGPTRVNLSYRWLDTQGRSVVAEGRRSPLGRDLPPGAGTVVRQTIRAPDEPGTYRLELDLVRERVSWFSQKRRVEPCRAEIEVLPPSDKGATADSPES